MAKYTWIGVSDDMLSTYSDSEFKCHEIYECFQHILTLEDVKSNLAFLNKKIISPTASYFSVKPDTGVFYRDQQDCVIWAVEVDTSRIYIWPDEEGDIKNRVYCANSIPEFLSHVYADAKKWFMEEEGGYPE